MDFTSMPKKTLSTGAAKILSFLMRFAESSLRREKPFPHVSIWRRLSGYTVERDTPVKIEKIIFENKRVELVVKMPDPSHCTTRDVPYLPKRLFGLFPHLAEHDTAANQCYF